MGETGKGDLVFIYFFSNLKSINLMAIALYIIFADLGKDLYV